MAIIAKKLQSTTLLQSFKNNEVYSGEFIISGVMPEGAMQVTRVVLLPAHISIADIMFQGRADGGFDQPTGNPRPNEAWFRQGVVNVRASGAGYTNTPMPFILGARISDKTLVLTATAWRAFQGELYLTPEIVRYKIVDYSVF